MKIIPMKKRIVVMRDEPESKTASGILLANPEKVYTGIVLATGSDEVDVEDRILFEKYSGIEFNEKTIISEDSVVAKLREEK